MSAPLFEKNQNQNKTKQNKKHFKVKVTAWVITNCDSSILPRKLLRFLRGSTYKQWAVLFVLPSYTPKGQHLFFAYILNMGFRRILKVLCLTNIRMDFPLSLYFTTFVFFFFYYCIHPSLTEVITKLSVSSISAFWFGFIVYQRL